MIYKLIKFYAFTCLIVVTISCSDNEVQEEQILITEEQLIGEWHSSNTFINEKPIAEFTENVYSIYNILGFRENRQYYLNYNSGEWVLEGNSITLENERDFKILKYEGDVLTLEAEIYESQTFIDLKGIESDELFTIREDFTRK